MYVQGHGNLSTRGQKFTYDGHTECSFKSYTCHINSVNGNTTSCSKLTWYDGGVTNKYYWKNDPSSTYNYVSCSGVITCAT